MQIRSSAKEGNNGNNSDKKGRREISDIRVLVVGGGFQYIQMFYEAGMRGATSVDDADIICFTGGEDVDPALYGEKPLNCTQFSPRRDVHESAVFAQAVAKNKPIVGICRGAQFLNVMNKGKLWQDVNNHCKSHSVIDMRTGELVHEMTSTHHQQMIPAPDAEIVAVACESTRKENETHVLERTNPESDDMEVVWYPNTLSLCFQPHPEFKKGPCRDFFLDLVDNYILPAC